MTGDTYFRKGFGLKGQIEGLLNADYHSALIEAFKSNGYRLTAGIRVRTAGERARRCYDRVSHCLSRASRHLSRSGTRFAHSGPAPLCRRTMAALSR